MLIWQTYLIQCQEPLNQSKLWRVLNMNMNPGDSSHGGEAYHKLVLADDPLKSKHTKMVYKHRIWKRRISRWPTRVNTLEIDCVRNGVCVGNFWD